MIDPTAFIAPGASFSATSISGRSRASGTTRCSAGEPTGSRSASRPISRTSR